MEAAVGPAAGAAVIVAAALGGMLVAAGAGMAVANGAVGWRTGSVGAASVPQAIPTKIRMMASNEKRLILPPNKSGEQIHHLSYFNLPHPS